MILITITATQIVVTYKTPTTNDPIITYTTQGYMVKTDDSVAYIIKTIETNGKQLPIGSALFTSGLAITVILDLS